MHILVTVYFLLFLLLRHASDVGVLLFAMLGVCVLLIPSMRIRALSSISGWNRQDTLMSLAFSSVFLFKLVSSAWSASPQLGLSNAVWHAHFFVWPFVLLAMLYCKPKLNQVLSAIALALCAVGAWMAWGLLLGKEGYYPKIFKINPGVLAELMLVFGAVLLVASSVRFRESLFKEALLYVLGACAALIVLYSTSRRTEWLSFFVIICLVVLWNARSWLNLWRTIVIITLFVACLIGVFYLRQERFLQAYREIMLYFTATAGDASAVTTSVGARLEMYRLGLSAFFDNPIFGMGSGVRPYLLQAYGGLSEAQFPHRHFHSEFLQAMVEGGIVWATLLSAAIVYWFKQAVFEAYKQSPILALMAAFLSISYMLAGSISASLIYGAANSALVMLSALIWVCIRQKNSN